MDTKKEEESGLRMAQRAGNGSGSKNGGIRVNIRNKVGERVVVTVEEEDGREP